MKADVESVMSTSPGARLKKGRESADLSLAEAAESLKMSPGAVRALEADDYRSLPNSTFVKGYIRSYARLLGIGSEDLVRGYEALTGCDKPEPVKPIETPRTAPKGAPILIAAIVLLIVLAAVYFLWGQDASTQPPSATAVVDEVGEIVADEDTAAETAVDTSVAETSEVELSDQYLTVPVREEAGEVSPQLQITRVPEGADEISESAAPTVDSAPRVDTAQPVGEPASGVPEPVSVEQPDTEQAVAPPPTPEVIPFSEVSAETESASSLAANRGVLSMTFTGDCWVEVRDASGELIYSNLKRLGETLTVEGKAPLEAKLGNGNVVALTYNGQPVTFRVPHHNVVRVRLGE